MGEMRPPLTKLVLNNFVVQKRPAARQAKTHTINGLVQHARRLRLKADKDEEKRAKLEAKAEKLIKEVLFLKTVPPDEMMKFALLNKKSFAAVGSNPKSKIEERVLCRAVEHKAIKDAIGALKEAHADWTEDLPHLIKGLGIRHREKKLQRLKRRGKLETYLKKEQRNMKLLQEFTGIDLRVDDNASDITGEKEKKKKKKSKSCGSSKNRKRKREQNLDEVSLKVMKKKIKVEEGMNGETKEDDDGSSAEESEGERIESNTQNEDESESDDDSGQIEGTEGDVTESDSENEDTDIENDNNNDSDVNGELDGESDAESDESDTDNSNRKPSIVPPKNDAQTEEANGRKKKTEPRATTERKLNKKMNQVEGKKRKGKKTEGKRESRPAQPVIVRSAKAAEVKQLDLKRIKTLGIDDKLNETEENGVPDNDGDNDEDEDFFEGGTKRKIKSSFFLGGMREEGSDDDGDKDDEDDDDDDSDDAVDTSKYFKRNIFRKREEGRGGRGRRGRGWKSEHTDRRGRGGGGMRREEGQGGRGWKENDGEERNGFTERRGRGGGGRGSDRRGGRGRGGMKREERPGGRRWRQNKFNGEERRGRGSGSDRRGGGRGREQYSDRRGRGGRGRGRFGQGRGGGGRGFSQMNSSNPNLIPVTSAGTGTSPSIPVSTTRPTTSLLHPSWMAKVKERGQSSALNAFKGKRMVFD